MKESNWWENYKYQCPNCQKFLCFKYNKEDSDFYYKKCSECGFEKKKRIIFAHYKHENGKVYMKNEYMTKFREVEIREFMVKGKKCLRVVPKFL